MTDKNEYDGESIGLVGGFHAIESTLSRSPSDLERAWVDRSRKDARMKKLVSALIAESIPVERVKRSELDHIFSGKSHQGVVAKIDDSAQQTADPISLDELLENLPSPARLLVLDQVKDPHNLGACIRTAEASGIDAIILPKDQACPVNATVRRVAAGAAEWVPIIYVGNLARSLEKIKESGIWLIGLAEEGPQSLYQQNLSGSVAIVVGSEDQGLRQLTRKHCDYLVHIPMVGRTPSLNVSVATAVVLYECLRQRTSSDASITS